MTDHFNAAALGKLEPFLLMVKSAKGAAAAKLIQDATSANGVFVFAELLDSPNIQELSSNEKYASFLSLLKLFSYGTYEDYKQHQSTFPPLTPAQVTKLKQLSLATFAKSSRTLSYPALLNSLSISSVRELEDLIIDSIYLDIVHGKLNQQQSVFEVEWSMGRDLRPGEIDDLLAALKGWAQTTSGVIQALDQKIESVRQEEVRKGKENKEHEKILQNTIQEVVNANRQKGQQSGGGGGGSEQVTQTPRSGRILRNTGGYNNREEEDVMEVDEPEPQSKQSTLDGMRGKKKPSSDSPKTVRKRNRGF
ncbi:PCI-domain-containing protein [Sistotremastrum suecicum HHB10207 ss-3]|uniref:PCI-domain-containing protein n=1 Tax=Sistotremastrum suecicum HHB10207 ss-3 TaxID=1314776 RepID=A0A166HLS7_9AGAM|nr:PCI-domain-containing protein [Sistotremastrum suecicum HHB10207 ss-3]